MDKLDVEGIRSTKAALKLASETRYKAEVDIIADQLNDDQKKFFSLACGKGASSFLSCLPLESTGYIFNKVEFRDTLCVRYNWPLPNIPRRVTAVVNANIAKYRQISPNIAKYRQISPNIAKYRQISPNIAKYRQISPNIAKYRQISPNIAKYRQISPNIAKYRQISPNIAKYRQISPNIASSLTSKTHIQVTTAVINGHQ